MEGLVKAMAIFILILSGALGIIGSFFGLSSAKGIKNYPLQDFVFLLIYNMA